LRVRLGLIAALLLSTAAAGATEPPPTTIARQQAAQAYDRGVAEFDAGNYVAAARSFLEADAAIANEDAVANALASAERARDPALVKEAAERVLERKSSNTTLTARARAALAEVEATAPPAPIDESSRLAPPPPPNSAPAPATTKEPAPGAAERAASASEDAGANSGRPLAPAVFFAGAGATALLGGLTIWSGVDTLAARNRLPGTQADNDAVMARAHRTDALLVGTLVVGALTAVAGLRWVDWSERPESVAIRANLGTESATLYVAGPLP
jgi:hypothetical protein